MLPVRHFQHCSAVIRMQQNWCTNPAIWDVGGVLVRFFRCWTIPHEKYMPETVIVNHVRELGETILR